MTDSIGICPATLLVEPMQASTEEVAAAARAAGAAGFTDASVWAFQLEGVATSGLRPRVLEAATAWAGDDDAAAAREAEHLATLAEQHGSSLLLAVTMEPTISDLDRARANLRRVAETVGAVGARVCVEFLAWSAIKDVRTAWELIEPLSDVGLVLDTFHWQRTGPDWNLLESIPGERIHYVQLGDAAGSPASDDAETEAMTARLLPGQGVVDFARLFTTLERVGADPFVAIEVFNPGLVSEYGSDRAAAAMRDAARSVLNRSAS